CVTGDYGNSLDVW
nr:immunoglobulin heavy chain junction region [Macaca mulatta]MOV41566.1 immunoglobulin heavy chain junction region [Macaca mulatta]MOV46126.1 immunoglobulin heavy chain junction region [Macaca mulatta]